MDAFYKENDNNFLVQLPLGVAHAHRLLTSNYNILT